jgi:sec-independent protein translocase protein TatA
MNNDNIVNIYPFMKLSILNYKDMDVLSPMHLLVILLIVILLFGGKKVPELMRSLGQGMREFKKASQFNPEEDKAVEKHDDTPKE